MSNFTADFRRFHSKRGAAGLQPAATFRKEELALVEAFERQRARTGHVRCVLDSTSGKFTAVLHAYLAYIQHLDKKDAIIVEQAFLPATPRKNHCVGAARHQLRAHTATSRSYLKLLGGPKCIGQILLLGAEAYCPSLPLYRSRLDAILQIALPYVCGPNSVIIIQGTTHTRRNTRFRHWLKQASLPASIYQPYTGGGGVPASAAPAKQARPKALIVQWRPSHGRTPILQKIPNSQFQIPHSLKIAA